MEPLALAQKTLQAINMMTQKTMPAQTAATTYHLDALVCFGLPLPGRQLGVEPFLCPRKQDMTDEPFRIKPELHWNR